VLVAAKQQAIIMLTPSGDIVFSRALGDRHPQTEGVAITRDHILIISDEATNGPATITLYHWPENGVGDGAQATVLPLRR